MRKYFIALVAIFNIQLLIFNCPAFAQKEWFDVTKGNTLYNKDLFTGAEIEYRKGLEQNQNSFEGHFNLGNALLRQEKYPEATQEYAKAVDLVKPGKDGKYSDADKKRLSAAYHNIGNALYQQQDYGKAVDAYKNALLLNPKDDETRYNLIKAMEMLQQQQQQQDQQNDENQNENQDQQQQEQQQQEQQQNEDENQNENQNDNENQMDKEQAEQILQALQQDEQDTQEKAKRQQMQSKFRTDKDW